MGLTTGEETNVWGRGRRMGEKESRERGGATRARERKEMHELGAEVAKEQSPSGREA